MRKAYTIFIVFFVCVFCSCSDSGQTDRSSSTLVFTTRGVPPDLLNSIRLFMFDGDNRNNADGQYYRELLNITRSDDKLTMSVESGKWNIGLVGCEDDPLSQLTMPVRGYDPVDLLMWKTQPAGGVLPNTPEIRTSLIEGIDIIPDLSQNASASLDRHVGMVRICLEDGVGFKTGAAGHTVYLKNVPTSLSWGGSLYPDKDSPEHSGDIRMTGSFTFVDAGNGRQKSSDNLSFIVPAHKSSNATDTTTHCLTLGLHFTTIGGTSFEKEVVLPKVPRNNRILQVNIRAKGGVEVSTNIADWNLETFSVSPQLYEMLAIGYDSSSGEWIYHLTMKQERNWWVTLGGAHPEYFEFIDSTASSGQLGVTTIRLKRSSRHPGGNQSATLYLYVSGYTDAVDSWAVQD